MTAPSPGVHRWIAVLSYLADPACVLPLVLP